MDHCFLLTNPNAEISIGMKKTMNTRTSRKTNVGWDGASGNSTGKNLLLASHNSRFRVSLQLVKSGQYHGGAAFNISTGISSVEIGGGISPAETFGPAVPE
jgi:hypothetical protein